MVARVGPSNDCWKGCAIQVSTYGCGLVSVICAGISMYSFYAEDSVKHPNPTEDSWGTVAIITGTCSLVTCIATGILAGCRSRSYELTIERLDREKEDLIKH